MSDTQVMKRIDGLALKYYETKDNQYFDQYATLAIPIIKRMIGKICTGSTRWDPDELFSILLTDMWRLFKRWEPVQDKKFHWLMLRQLKNKAINYIHQIEGRIRKICPTCGTKQNEDNCTDICTTCKSSLRLPDRVIEEPFESSYFYTPDYLKSLADKDLVEKILEEVENDPKTYQILVMLLDGETKTAISNEVEIAQNALNNRIKKCQKIVKKLINIQGE